MASNEIKIEVPADIVKSWQEISDVLARMIEIPAALLMRFTDPDIEVFVTSNSENNPYHPGDKEKLPGSGLYCETVIKTKDKLLVADALADVNWKDNPGVKLNMISYLGFPILLPDGKPFGTICVLDNKRNEYSEIIEKLMLGLRSLMESHLEIIYMNQCLGDKNKRLSDYLMELQSLRGKVSICANCKGIKDNQNQWHPIEQYLIRHPEARFSHGLCPQCMRELYPGVAEDS